MAINLNGTTVEINSGVASGTASGGTPTTLTGTGFSTTWAKRSLWITGGTGSGQRRMIKAATTTTLTLYPGDDWVTIPDATSTFSISYMPSDVVSAIAGAENLNDDTDAYTVRYSGSFSLLSGGHYGGEYTGTYLTGVTVYFSTAAGSLLHLGRTDPSGELGIGGGALTTSGYTPGTTWQMLGIVEMNGTMFVSKRTDHDTNKNSGKQLNVFADPEEFILIDCTIIDISIRLTNGCTSKNCKWRGNWAWVGLAAGYDNFSNNTIVDGLLLPRFDNGATGDIYDFVYLGERQSPQAAFQTPIFSNELNKIGGTSYWFNPNFQDGFENAWTYSSVTNAGYNYEAYTVDILVQDLANTPIEGVILSLKDVNGDEGWTINKDTSANRWVPVKAYTLTTDANGTTTNTNFSQVEDAYVVTGLARSGLAFEEFGPFNLTVRKYGYVYQSYNGKTYTERSAEKLIMANNTKITETTQATVDSYTELETSEKFYDKWQSLLTEPANVFVDSTLFDTSNGVTDLGVKNLIIDASAVSVFVYSDPTVTIKASTFTGGATATTGTVTTTNGALLLGGTFNCDINYQSGASTTLTNVTCTGAIDFNTAGTYTLDGCTINEVTNSSGGAVTLVLTNGSTVTTNTGPSITINDTRTISITNIVAGSRLQIYNTTTATEIYNAVVAGTSYAGTYSEGGDFTTGDTIRVRLTCQSGTSACDWFQQNTVASASGWTVVADQQSLTAYTTIGIDGSTVSEFSLDEGNLQVDANDLDGFSQKKRLVAWMYYAGTTEEGIRSYFRAIELEDEGNAKINSSIIDLKVDNISNRQLYFTDNDFRLYRDDGADWVLYPSTGGYGISYGSGKVYVKIIGGVSGQSSGYTPGTELNIQTDSGLTVQATVRSKSGVQQGGVTTLTEVATGQYTASFPLDTINDGHYIVTFTSAGSTIGFGDLYVRNNEEITQELYETKVEADARQTDLITEHDDTQAQIAALNNLSTADVAAELATYDAPTKAELDVAQSVITGRVDTAETNLTAEHDATQSDVAAIKAQTDVLTPKTTGTVFDGAASSTSFITNLTETTDGHYNRSLLVFTSGTLAGQARIISSYLGSNKSVTFEKPFTEAPANSDAFTIHPAYDYTLLDIATMPIPGPS